MAFQAQSGHKQQVKTLPTNSISRPRTNALKLNVLGPAPPGGELTPGVGEGRNLPSLSGVNTLPEATQAVIVLGLMAGLAALTVGGVAVLGQLEAAFPGAMAAWEGTFPLLGPIFMAAGVSHFTLHEDFVNMYPPLGTWGFWYLPGSPSFHVNWTGVVEFVGGLMLTVGGVAAALGLPLPGGASLFVPDGALLLFALTYAVSFANIYMYTHGAILPKAMENLQGEPIPIAGHAVRGFFQVVLLTQLWTMAKVEPLVSSLLQ